MSPYFEALTPQGGFEITGSISSEFTLKRTGWTPVVCVQLVGNKRALERKSSVILKQNS